MSTAEAASGRLDRLDAARGAAMLWMAGFHLAFDLNHFGLVTPRQDFYGDPLWTLQRTAIVSAFLFCAGLAQAVATDRVQPWPRFWRRWAQVAGCALVVSLGSMLMFPRSWISFGVLHGLAVMLVIVRLLAPLGRRPWGPGLLMGVVIASLALPTALQHPFFDSRWMQWTGLVTRKPVTEDFVPVLPWLAAMSAGLAAGQWALRHRPAWLAGALPGRLLPLARLGRWPLTFYMSHQPVLIGAVLAATMFAR